MHFDLFDIKSISLNQITFIILESVHILKERIGSRKLYLFIFVVFINNVKFAKVIEQSEREKKLLSVTAFFCFNVKIKMLQFEYLKNVHVRQYYIV